MSRFDIYHYSKDIPFVIDVQANLLGDLKTRVVIPLLLRAEAKHESLPKLKPIITLGKKDYVLMTTDIGTLRISDLGERAGNAEGQRQIIVDAIDFLFQGF